MLFSPQILVRQPLKRVSTGSLGLQTNLTGFWSFENTSWLDDTASATTLSATSSPTSSSTAPAMVGNYLGLDGSSYLTAADNTNINTGGGSFSIQAWVYYPAGGPGDYSFFVKGTGSFASKEWGFGTRFTSNHKWNFKIGNTSGNEFEALSTTDKATNTWTHLVGTYDSGTKGLILYVNAAAEGSNTLTGTLYSGTDLMKIGANINASPTINANGTRYDQCGFWKGRVLSASDVTALYNSGAGLSYAAMA